MATKYDQSLIITGGKLINNQGVNLQNFISFERKVKENADPLLTEDYIEVNCKIIIDKKNYTNFIGSLEDYIPVGGTPEDGEKKIDETSNLVILETTSDKKLYTLDLGSCTLLPLFNKKGDGQILLTLNSDKIAKTDHSTKTDHSSIPWNKV